MDPHIFRPLDPDPDPHFNADPDPDPREKKNKLRRLKKPLETLIKEDYPEELREVALLLRAMPVTQVSVERLFSALRLLKSERRSRLKEDVLKAILVLKANK